MLGQVAVDEKSNEITAVPALLELLDLDGAVVSLDAMHGLPQTAAAIRQKRADYLLCIKDDRRRLTEDVKLYFDDAIPAAGEPVETDAGLLTHTMEPDNGHGRLDERTAWASGEVGWLRRRHPDWPDLGGIVCVEGRRLDFATGKQSTRRRYYLTSLDPREVGAARLGELVRGHWSIENQLHWCLDVSFGDDKARVRKDHGPANLAAVKRLCLGLAKRSTPTATTKLKAERTSLKMRRLMCNWTDDYLIRTLTGGDETDAG